MIPEGFKEKMQSILGDEYPRFIEALEEREAVRGMRVNLIKTTPEKLLADGAGEVICIAAASDDTNQAPISPQPTRKK